MHCALCVPIEQPRSIINAVMLVDPLCRARSKDRVTLYAVSAYRLWRLGSPRDIVAAEGTAKSQARTAP